MAFKEFYCDTSTGANINAGDLTANGVVTSTNGNWSTVTNIFTATGGTPFSGVTIGDYASVYLDGATLAVYVARVTAIGGGGLTLTLSSTDKSGTAPTTGATGRTCTTGGAWKGPNGASGFPFGFIDNGAKSTAGDNPRVNFKSGTNYAITAAITHSANNAVVFQGYTTAAGDGGMAIIDGGTSGASYTLLTLSGANGNVLQDLIFQNNGSTGSATGVVVSGVRNQARRLVIHDVCGHGLQTTNVINIEEIEVYACNKNNTSGIAGINMTGGGIALRCIAHDNAGSNTVGFLISSALGNLFFCIADTNGSHGISFTGNGVIMIFGCVCYNNVGDGIKSNQTNQELIIENSIFVSNGGYGIDNTAALTGSGIFSISNAFYNNTSGETTGLNASLVINNVTLTGDPFTAASTGNFTLDSTTGEGAACRAAGRGAFTQTQASYTGTASTTDIGATQNASAGGGGGGVMGSRIFTGF